MRVTRCVHFAGSPAVAIAAFADELVENVFVEALERVPGGNVEADGERAFRDDLHHSRRNAIGEIAGERAVRGGWRKRPSLAATPISFTIERLDISSARSQVMPNVVQAFACALVPGFPADALLSH